MNYFITNIKINKLLHLQNLEISIPENNPHLIITGKNGSGKTILLRALADFLELVKNDKQLSFLGLSKDIESGKRWLGNSKNEQERLRNIQYVDSCQKQYDSFYGKVSADFTDIYKIAEKIKERNFIFAFYPAERKAQMKEPQNPTKPDFSKKGKLKDALTDQFLFFLADLKVQEALARNEKLYNDANSIRAWFDGFESIMRDIFQDENLQLVFNYKNYSFSIQTKGKSFKFTEMSDGFIAAIDIIADLILKMQGDDALVSVYQKEGIVLIDEIETHLHLELQRIVLPLLTKVFPNIQFIVTTHSPFVLSSMNNAIAYDLEHRSTIDDLTEYSYEALAEGFFGVETDSSYMKMRLNVMKELLGKEKLTLSEKNELKNLLNDFEKIPEAVSPLLVGEFRQLKINHSAFLNSL